MSRFYSVVFEGASVTAANGDYDLFYIAPADDKPVKLWELLLYVTSELGDAQEEWLRLAVIRGHTTASSGGNSATPTPLMATAQAAGFTARTVDPTIATAGSPLTVNALGMNVRAGMERIWLPETGPECSQGNTSILVRMMAAVADDVTMSGTLIVEETG